MAGERRRIARELHDIISHALGVMVLQAGAADQALDREPAKVRQAVHTIRATGLDAIGEMGRLVGLLRDDDGSPATAPQPTLADIDRLVAAACADSADIQVRIAGEARPLGPAVELNAYRVVQEGLTNALKQLRAAPSPSPSRTAPTICWWRSATMAGQPAADPAAGSGWPGCASGSRSSADASRRAGGRRAAGP